MELETKLRRKNCRLRDLERDRLWFSDQEKEKEKEEKERKRLMKMKRFASPHPNSSESLTVMHSLYVFLCLTEALNDFQDAHSALSRNTNRTTTPQKTQTTPPRTTEFTITRWTRLTPELQLKNEVPQSKNYNLRLTSWLTWMLARKLSCEGFRTEEIWASYTRNCTTKLTVYGYWNLRMSTSELIVLRKRQTSVKVLREQGGCLEGECRYLRS